MALIDYLPVILFALAAFMIAGDLKNMLAMLIREHRCDQVRVIGCVCRIDKLFLRL